jgi:ribosome maturation factor RimP
MARTEELQPIVEPIVASLDAEIYDLEFESGVLRLTVDRPGGVDLETIAEVTRQLSRQLDLDDPIPGKYTLEVTSPGLERNLRTAAHWATAIGHPVRVKTKPNVESDRRIEGVVTAVDDDAVTIDVDGTPARVRLDDVDRARTVFVWGPQPKPGGPKKQGRPNTSQPDPSTAAMAATNESENS